MKNRFKPKWRAILLHLKRYGRPDILIAGISMLVVSVMLFQIGGLMDYWSMGELYTVEGTLQDCYIEDTRLGRHRTRILRRSLVRSASTVPRKRSAVTLLSGLR